MLGPPRGREWCGRWEEEVERRTEGGSEGGGTPLLPMPPLVDLERREETEREEPVCACEPCEPCAGWPLCEPCASLELASAVEREGP